MTRRSLGTLLLGLAAHRAQARAADLQTALAAVAPGLPKWVCLCIVHEPAEAPRFEWHGYRDTADRRDFWPASTIKLDAAIAALEQLHALGLPAQTRARFEHHCLRRLLFHEVLPEAERFRISPAMLPLLRHGGTGLSGLETAHPDSGPSSWTPAVQAAFPGARYFHKSGLISNCALDLAAIDARAQGGPCALWLLGIRTGHATEPKGEPLVGQMAEAATRWLQARM